MPCVRIVPLGGLGEIGLNALAIEAEGAVILLDCGLLFAQPRYPGVDYLIPDFSYLRERRSQLKAVFLTHGHEDHVGALPHLLGEVPFPVYGTPMTLALARLRLGKLSLSAREWLRPVTSGASVETGPFRVEFLRVTHSTADAAALAVETPGGTLLHSGDFKLDDTPVDGRLTDEAGLARWGGRGVDVLLCDSTNASAPGRTPSERLVGRNLHRLFGEVEGCAYVATFSSSVHRIQQVIQASRDTGRVVTLLGRSLVGAVRAARRLGYLKVAPGDLIPEPRSRGWPRERLTVLLSGSQGEPGSALFRVAHGLERHHQILPEDHVFFSARLIAGNETNIHRLVNLCLRQGARTHYEEVSEVHVSGHASAEDVERMLELTRPTYLVPIHGELRHLDGLARLAVGRGVPPERVFRGENGQSLILENHSLRWGERVRTGRVVVDSSTLSPAEGRFLEERRRLGEEGVAVAVAAWAEGAWKVRVHLRGVFSEELSPEAEREAERAVERYLSGRSFDTRTVEARMSLALRRHFRRLSGRRPLVLAHCGPLLDSRGDAP